VLRVRSNVVVSVYQDPRTFDEAQKEFAVIRSPHSLADSPRALLTRGTFRASKHRLIPLTQAASKMGATDVVVAIEGA
jgi:hypothetical protein